MDAIIYVEIKDREIEQTQKPKAQQKDKILTGIKS